MPTSIALAIRHRSLDEITMRPPQPSYIAMAADNSACHIHKNTALVVAGVIFFTKSKMLTPPNRQMKIAAILILALLVTGCTHSIGNSLAGNARLISQIHLNKTTKAQVRRLLGTPMGISRSSGRIYQEIWTYTYTNIAFGQLTISTLTTQFDEAGIVRHLHSFKANSHGPG